MNDASTASPLASPALGTATNDLIQPCSAPRAPRATLPAPPVEPAVAVALSGGGFRASLSALGVLRFLADAGLLAQVRHVSSVSGGSVANGLFAARYGAVREASFTPLAFDEQVLAPFVAAVSGRSLSRRLLRRAWRLIGPKTRTDLLADEFDRLLYDRLLLEDLPEGCRFIINAANLSTGVRFGFERDVVGDYVVGTLPTRGTGLHLSRAVAASAAVPGALAPVVLRDIEFPCQRGRVARLVDGGAYDNMGLEPVDNLTDSLLVALNAGGLFVTGAYGRIPVIRDLQLSQALLYRQSTALRRRWMVERFQEWERAHRTGEAAPAWGRRGVLFGLATTFDVAAAWLAANPDVPVPAEIALVKTSFDRFPVVLCRKLVHAGWWLTGATLATYHPDVLPADLPRWRELP